MLAHLGKMTVFYKRGRVEHSARQMVSPLRVDDVVRDGIPKERRKPEHQSSITDGLQPNSNPSFLPIEHPMTSCCVCGAPNDLEQRHRAVAAPEKPPEASFQPVTNNKDYQANNRRTAFRRVSSTNEYIVPHNAHAESLET